MRVGAWGRLLSIPALALALTAGGVACDGAGPETGECGPGETFCSGSGCVNTAHNEDHCGACGNSCDGCDRCLRGVCDPTCCGEESDCGTIGAPVCVHLPTDLENCGSCGNECPEGDRCVNGQCIR